MLEMFVFETMQLTEQLEQAVMASEKASSFESDSINEIFRIMHTIKGSAAMMLFDNISTLAHSMEDVFFYLRENNPENADYAKLADLVLLGIDFIKNEVEIVKGGAEAKSDASALINDIKSYLTALKEANPQVSAEKKPDKSPPKQPQYYISPNKPTSTEGRHFYKARVFFQDGCEMENIRAYTLIHGLKDFASDIYHIPEDIIENDDTATVIKSEGFTVFFSTDRSDDEVKDFLGKTIFLKELECKEIDAGEAMAGRQASPATKPQAVPECKKSATTQPEKEITPSVPQSMVSVHVSKLDRLMDLVGELVISEAMVTQNPDLRGLTLDNFQKAARQLGKITGELQDMVMSIRMVPLATTFHKMQRVVRDMSKKLNKEVDLALIGEDTEVDKNIIEKISDPLMHLIRNSIDHGLEDKESRLAVGKTADGKVTLEAKNAGSEVLINIKDDGRGLDKEKILTRAREHGLIYKPESELTDREIFSFIFLPGFSTKEKVTEFSGRGVGMDVVTKNINAVGGVVLVDSVPGEGTTITLKIPLTLAIVDGMTIGVGKARYTIPITAIRQSFRPQEKDIVTDPDGNEMIMVRGQCYPVLRIHHLYKTKTEVTTLTDGIVVMVENDGNTICIFADELIGEQQVVVKAMPSYIKEIRNIAGLAGCTLLGDGSISLILDVAGLINAGYSH
jgi:two-component system chemotaxis sensor kinase CheA